MKIIKQDIIRTEYDLTDRGIIDWNRLNGNWRNASDAIRTVSSWFINRAAYTVIEHNLAQYPTFDCPLEWHSFEWSHVGEAHHRLGQMYWNFFQQEQLGSIHFSDSPDFWGTFNFSYGDGNRRRFWGDIGTVSASAFSQSQKQMGKNDIWISVCDSHTQVVIEALDDIHTLWSDQILKGTSLDYRPRKGLKPKFIQARFEHGEKGIRP